MHFMNRWKLLLGFLAVVALALAVFFVLNNEKALVTHPKGIIAKLELDLIATNYLLMLIIVIPTFILLFFVAWKYRAKNRQATYDPDSRHGPFVEWLLWLIPSIIIAVMALHAWKKTHELDPYRPLVSDIAPLTIQVVALDWKWLFIYPEQEIATVNFVQFPAQTPIHFALSADGSPMNAFWIPQLSGQIYTMAGMTTILHIMADEPGIYSGRASEINGKGLADMTFIVKTSTEEDFAAWVAQVKGAAAPLTQETYAELLEPSVNHPKTVYSDVEKGLFRQIVTKNMH
jgi:cytochrome o ubiquinol oxidase subunit II